MAVRLVVLDCDRTLWDHADVTSLARPFRRVGADAVEDRAGVRVTLFPETRSLLEGLRTRGLVIACASWNEPQPVNDIFGLLEIGHYFDYRMVEPHPEKHRTINALLDQLAAQGTPLAPEQVLYVDDRRIHLDAIHQLVGPIRFLQYGVDIPRLTGVLAYLDGMPAVPTPGHPASGIYLDYAATTPVDPRVVAAMQPYFTERFGNAGSVHATGQTARAAVDDARRAVAGLIGADPREIVFTSGATESNNAAIFGTVFSPARPGRHLITVATEHHAVLEPCRWLEQHGAAVTILPVDGYGMVDPGAVRRAIRPDTVLVSVMHGNNEIGTLAPIAEIARVAREHGVLCHTDATQSAGIVPIDVKDLGVDLLSFSAHKRYGPKGVGALYIRSGVTLEPFLRGGSQERGRRGGTENVAAIVGFGAAARHAREAMSDEAGRLAVLRDRLAAGLGALDGACINGHPSHRLPGILSVSLAGADSESLLLALDLEGIAASSGSACTSGSLEPSHVIAALGLPAGLAAGTLRFSLGRWTTTEEIDRVRETLPRVLGGVRGAGTRRT